MLNYTKAQLMSVIYSQKKEIKKLHEVIDKFEEQSRYDDLREEIKTAKFEAIKELAERLKERMSINQSGYILITEMPLDNLVKEMTEDEV